MATIEVTDNNFEAESLKPKPVIVDFKLVLICPDYMSGDKST